jgi:hypothetical protein
MLSWSNEFIALTWVGVRAKNSDIIAQVTLYIALPAILANFNRTVRRIQSGVTSACSSFLAMMRWLRTAAMAAIEVNELPPSQSVSVSWQNAGGTVISSTQPLTVGPRKGVTSSQLVYTALGCS